MQYFIKRAEAKAFPDGTRFRNKKTGTEYIISKECKCGEYLHYEVKQVGHAYSNGTVWQHLDIERLCEVMEPAGMK
jgi:hypothetical protein